MQIDPLLCQKILIAVESDPGAGNGPVNLNIEGYEPVAVAHHVKYLADTELVEVFDDVTNMDSPYPELLISDITPQGRAYLDQRDADTQPAKKIGF